MFKFRFWRAASRSALVAIAASLPLALALPAGAVSDNYSGTWAGLVSPGGGYVQVTADVVVPHITSACGADSNVAVFTGLGGWGRVPFVQNGFVVTPRGISVWSEVFDAAGHGPITSINLPVRAGDHVRLGLAFSASATVLTFYWSNLTLHRTTTQRVTNARRYYNGGMADYIVERSSYPHAGSPLARYSDVVFTNARAARYGQWVPAYNTNTIRVATLGARGNIISHVTAAAGQGFKTSWAGCR